MVSNKLLLFDFDGVIADSYPAAQKTFSKLEPNLPREEYLRRHEGNIYDSEKQLGDKRLKELDWWEEYLKHVPFIQPHEGMTKTIQELSLLYPLFIISSTTNVIIEGLLSSFGIAGCFQKVLGADVHTSKIIKMNLLLEEHSALPSDCLFITDTLGDLREASKVGIPCLAVSWGFHDVATLERGQSEAIIFSPHDMTLKVQELLANPSK